MGADTRSTPAPGLDLAAERREHGLGLAPGSFTPEQRLGARDAQRDLARRDRLRVHLEALRCGGLPAGELAEQRDHACEHRRNRARIDAALEAMRASVCRPSRRDVRRTPRGSKYAHSTSTRCGLAR